MSVTMQGYYRAALDSSVPWPDEKPRRTSAASLLFKVPGFWEYALTEMRVVPAEYTADVDHQRVVACMCGRRPVLGLGEMRTCSQARAYIPGRTGCERTFLASRTVTFVLGGPKS